MSSSHATKKNRRYRYYVSQAVLQYREQEAGTVTRISAPSLENIVISRFKRLISMGQELTKAITPVKLLAHHQQAIVTRGKALANDWDVLAPARQIDLLKKCINRVTVGSNEVKVSFSVDGLINTLLDNVGLTAVTNHALTDEFVIAIAVKLKRCGRETRLIIPNDDHSVANQATIQAIQGALVKALAWNQALVSGTVSSMTELAETNHVTQRYIAHLIKLAYLAPDILDAINSSSIPPELTLDRLKRGFPLDWTEQRETLGFNL